MCYQMTPIATYDDRHVIAQCEHGTLHLRWERLVLSFHPDELLMIARTLHHYAPENRDTLATPYVTLLWNSADMAQLWLLRYGLYLCPQALDVLMTLIEQTVQALESSSVITVNQGDLKHTHTWEYNLTASLN